MQAAFNRDKLNPQASVLVDAQTDIKTAIKQGVLSRKGKKTIKVQVNKIIDRALSKISSQMLKADGRIALMRFADRAYTKFADELEFIAPALLPSLVVIIQAVTATKLKGVYHPLTTKERIALRSLADIDPITFNTRAMGIPLQEFHQTYIRRVSTALDNLFKSYAFDPNDGRTEREKKNSLRNLAEMQVRYEQHQEEISGFKSRGVRLVVCSVHADCSDRCSQWQGRVYSMDGTEGYTEDGKHFVPLEEATDIYYTAKSTGRTWKNGLLGFNCRHKLYEYKPGMVIPSISAEERKQEYEITKTQRSLERKVIRARENALMNKDVDVKEYRRWKTKAANAFNEYVEFSKKHKRAYYPDRIKIL